MIVRGIDCNGHWLVNVHAEAGDVVTVGEIEHYTQHQFPVAVKANVDGAGQTVETAQARAVALKDRLCAIYQWCADGHVVNFDASTGNAP